MKCKYCGSDMSIEDAKCRYCGIENPYYKKHRADMRSYKDKFEKTRADVYEKTGHFTKATVKITAIAILVALNLIVLFILLNSWNISNFIIKYQTRLHVEEHREKLSELERTGDYIGLVNYYDYKSLYRVNLLDEFNKIKSVSMFYDNIYANIMRVAVEKNTYRSPQEYAAMINEDLNSIYDSMEKKEYDDEEEYSEAHVKAMQNALDQVYALLHTYCNVSREDLDHFADLSPAKRQLLIEEGVSVYEE